MANLMTSCKPNSGILNLCPITYPFEILIKILAENALVALEWEAMLVRAMLDLNNNARRAFTSDEDGTFPRLKRPEIAINQPCWEKMDVNNADNLKTVEHPGEKKCKKKKKKKKYDPEKKKKEEKEKREAEEKERLREWEENWEKQYQEQEELDKLECCQNKGYCLKPKTESKIWINVVQDRSVQEMRIALKHCPVPKPKPPPMPPLNTEPTLETTFSRKKVVQRVDKKVGTTKKKK